MQAIYPSSPFVMSILNLIKNFQEELGTSKYTITNNKKLFEELLDASDNIIEDKDNILSYELSKFFNSEEVKYYYFKIDNFPNDYIMIISFKKNGFNIIMTINPENIKIVFKKDKIEQTIIIKNLYVDERTIKKRIKELTK